MKRKKMTVATTKAHAQDYWADHWALLIDQVIENASENGFHQSKKLYASVAANGARNAASTEREKEIPNLSKMRQLETEFFLLAFPIHVERAPAVAPNWMTKADRDAFLLGMIFNVVLTPDLMTKTAREKIQLRLAEILQEAEQLARRDKSSSTYQIHS